MKEIQLSKQGKNKGKFVTFVDDDNYEYLNQFNWAVAQISNTFYAVRKYIINGKNKTVFMHRIIMNTPLKLQVDHIDHNGLNNQKYNLRNCTISQNRMNKTPYGSSKYLGVSWFKRDSCWKANIKTYDKMKHLGYFNSEEDAAHAYDESAKIYHREFANLNFK